MPTTPPKPNRVAAFFDLDRTVLTTSSSTLWARYLHRQGQVNWRDMVRLGWYTLRYKLAIINMDAVVRVFVENMRGQSETELIAESARWFREMVAPCIAPRARERVEEHKVQGHTVALLTASTAYVAQPVARDLGLGANVICTRLQVADDTFTGRCVEPVCYGPGKVHWAKIFAAERGLDLAASYFYTDSYTDLAMLEAVAHPIAVNPDPRLRRLAGKRRWPVAQFF